MASYFQLVSVVDILYSGYLLTQNSEEAWWCIGDLYNEELSLMVMGGALDGRDIPV